MISVLKREPTSRWMVATAAIHGVYNNVNTRNARAVTGVKMMEYVNSQTVANYHVKTLILYRGKMVAYQHGKMVARQCAIYHTIPIGIVGLSRIKVVYRKSGEVVKR